VATFLQSGGCTGRRRSVVFWAVVLGATCAVGCLGCGSFAARGLNAEGVRLFEQTRYQEAVQQFQKAIDNDPTDADAYYNLAGACHRLGTIHQLTSELSQAESYYQLCLNRDPDHRECHRGLSVLLVQQGRREEAFRLLQSWADRRPDWPDPKIELARLSEEFGNREAAKQYLADALHLRANDARALAALGRLREQAGEHLMALQNYQQSLQVDPYQGQVAARVAALQSVAPVQSVAPPSPSPAGTAGAAPLATNPATSLR